MTLLDELHLTYTGRKRLNGDLDKRVAYRVVHELMNRKGFLGWFGQFHEDTQEEILETLIDVVCETLEE